jgi:hypothetical protein
VPLHTIDGRTSNRINTNRSVLAINYENDRLRQRLLVIKGIANPKPRKLKSLPKPDSEFDEPVAESLF